MAKVSEQLLLAKHKLIVRNTLKRKHIPKGVGLKAVLFLWEWEDLAKGEDTLGSIAMMDIKYPKVVQGLASLTRIIENGWRGFLENTIQVFPRPALALRYPKCEHGE